MVGLVFLSVYALNQRDLASNNPLTAVANQNDARTAQANAVDEANVRATAQAQAEEQAKIARAGELAAQAVSLRESQFDLSMLLSIEAFQIEDT